MKNLLNQYFSLFKTFVPEKAELSAVGLDIGSGDCKLIELKRVENKYELLNWAIEPIVNGDVQSAVKKILENLKTTGQSPHISVFGKGTLVRYIDMPRMSSDELRNCFSIEADKYFPFSQDQIYTDCYILDPQAKGKQMAVMAAATKREIVDQRIKLLSDIDCQVHFIGLNPVALANAVNVLKFEDGEETAGVSALLDMGESVSSLTIFVDGLPRFNRDVFIGGRDFTKRISNALSITEQEAEKVKSAPGKQMKEVLTACETSVMNIVQELKLSFDYFVTEKNIEISKLYLTGGGSMLEGISEIFEKNLEIGVSKWDPITRLQVSSDIAEKKLGSKSLKLGVAVGLALYHYD